MLPVNKKIKIGKNNYLILLNHRIKLKITKEQSNICNVKLNNVKEYMFFIC